MKRGISPIVAVVLLIAIAVISAVGLYFWVGGITTKQPTIDQPNVIGANVVDSQNGLVLIQNLGTTPVEAQMLEVVGVDTKGCWLGSEIPPGQQGMCRMTGFTGTATIYGPSIAAVTVQAPEGDTNPRFIGLVCNTVACTDADEQALYSYLDGEGYIVTNYSFDTAEDLGVEDVLVVAERATVVVT